MIITDFIKEQIFQVAVMFMAGLALGGMYQLWGLLKGWIRKKAKSKETASPSEIPQKGKSAPAKGKVRKRFPRAAIATAALELLFWLWAALFTDRFLYYAAYGDISFHNFSALVIGVLLWRRCFYDTISPAK